MIMENQNSHCGQGINSNDRPLLPLRIPCPRSSQRNRISNRVMAFSTCSLAIMISVYFCLLITQMVLLGIWAKLHHSLDTTLPRTFAWRVIIQLFGSTYDDCTDHTGPRSVQMAPQDSCKYYHSPPIVSILAMALHVALIVCGIFYPLEKYIFNLTSNLAFKMILLSTILTTIFTGRNVIMHFVYIGRNSNFEPEFDKRMRDDMRPLEDTPLHISKKWQITQEANLCCGVQNFTDWKFHIFPNDINPRYPMSCCDKSKSFCHIYPSRSDILENGCLSPELRTVHDYAEIIIGLSFLALLTSIIFVFLVHIMDSILLRQQNVGDPIQSCTKILFTRHATPNIPTPTSTSTPTLTEDDKQDMCIFTSKQFIPQHEHNDGDHCCQFEEGGGDYVMVDPRDPHHHQQQQQEKQRSNFTLNRKSTLHICVNSWGIACRTVSSSQTKGLILRKETQV